MLMVAEHVYVLEPNHVLSVAVPVAAQLPAMLGNAAALSSRRGSNAFGRSQPTSATRPLTAMVERTALWNSAWRIARDMCSPFLFRFRCMALSQRVWPTAPGGVAIAVPSRQCAGPTCITPAPRKSGRRDADGGRVERVQQRV